MTPSVIGSIVRAKLGGVTGLDRFVVLSTLLGPRIVSVSEREHHPFPLRNAPRRRNAPGQLAAPPRPPHSALTRHCSSSTSAGCVIGPVIGPVTRHWARQSYYVSSGMLASDAAASDAAASVVPHFLGFRLPSRHRLRASGPGFRPLRRPSARR